VTTGTGEDAPGDILAAGVVLHEGRQGSERRGIEAVAGGFEDLRASFPGFSVDVHDVVVECDRAVSRHTNVMPFEHEYQGLAPTGETHEFELMTLVRVEDGKIAEIWDAYDTAYVNEQLRITDED
jgi:predicted ester cyclase